MTLKKSQAKTQYERAKKLGWLPFFIASAEKHTRNYFDAADLMGIASRETELDPKWLTKPGDGGNGFGLMQADKRSFASWIKTGEWKQADKSIEMGAIVLMKKWDDVQYCVGIRCTVTSSKDGKRYTFTGKDVKGVVAQRVAIAAYNAGRWAHYAVSNGKDVDAYTTGKDYSKDVMSRAAKFRELLKADGYLTTETKLAAKQTDKPVEQVNEKDETPQISPTTTPDAEPPIISNDITGNLPSMDAVQQQIPRIKTGVRWLGGLSIGGIASTTYATFGGLAPWQIFVIGFLTALLLTGLAWLLISYNKQIFALVKHVAGINADPTKVPVQLVSRSEVKERLC